MIAQEPAQWTPGTAVSRMKARSPSSSVSSGGFAGERSNWAKGSVRMQLSAHFTATRTASSSLDSASML